MSSLAATTIASSPQRHHQPSQPQPQQSPLKKREINLTDDPDKLLNDWLGELENLIGVSWLFKFFLIIIYFSKSFSTTSFALLVRSLWNFKSNVKNWCRHFEHWKKHIAQSFGPWIVVSTSTTTKRINGFQKQNIFRQLVLCYALDRSLLIFLLLNRSKEQVFRIYLANWFSTSFFSRLSSVIHFQCQ